MTEILKVPIILFRSSFVGLDLGGSYVGFGELKSEYKSTTCGPYGFAAVKSVAHLEVWVRRRRPVALHGDEPGRRHLVRVGAHGHAQRRPQVVGQLARLLLLQADLELLALID